MTSAQLLAVVEVPSEDRVRCQSAGCNHPVFRRIHVVRENSAVRVYGSECFKKLFVGLPVASSMPQYTSSDGRHLTEEERQLLIENTERLIQQFESEYQAELARKAALAAARLASVQTPPPPMPPKPVVVLHTREFHRFEPPLQSLPKPPVVSSPSVQQVSETQAKQIVRSKYGVDSELPGWRGLVLAEMERMKRVGS